MKSEDEYSSANKAFAAAKHSLKRGFSCQSFGAARQSFQIEPQSARNFSLKLTIACDSKKPRGLSTRGSIRVFGSVAPSKPIVPAIDEVPLRCIPLTISAVFFSIMVPGPGQGAPCAYLHNLRPLKHGTQFPAASPCRTAHRP